MYDALIIGGGHASVAAGVYAGRKKIKTALVADKFGGQSIVAAEIENWIGTKKISGVELASQLEDHLRSFEDVEIIDDLVEKVEKDGDGFKSTLKSGKTIDSKTVLVTAGSHRRKLGVPGDSEFEGRGVAYCSTCDAPIFKNKITAVVGSGNAGLEAVRDLLTYASKVYLLNRGDKIAGDESTFEEINKDDRVELMNNIEVKEIFGEGMVKGVKLLNNKTNEESELKLDGLFVEIGSVPNSHIVKGLVNINERGEIITNSDDQSTSCEGIWAAGDVDNGRFKQNNVAVGDAIKALLSLYSYLNKQK